MKANLQVKVSEIHGMASRLNSSSTTPEAISPMSEDRPGAHRLGTRLTRSGVLTRWKPRDGLRKCVSSTRMLTNGEKPVASAAPNMPSPHGKMKM